MWGPDLHSSKGYFPICYGTWNARGHRLQCNAYVSKKEGLLELTPEVPDTSKLNSILNFLFIQDVISFHV